MGVFFIVHVYHNPVFLRGRWRRGSQGEPWLVPLEIASAKPIVAFQQKCARWKTNWPHIHYLNMRSILLDGIVHWNPLLFCFNFVAAAFVSSSGHLIGMYHTILFHTRPRFLLHNDWSKIFHASFWNPLSRSIITLYFHIFLWLPARIISSEFTSCMTSYIKRVFLQNWFRFVFPYIYH